MYEVSNYNPETDLIEFENVSSKQKFTFKNSDDMENKYRKVHYKHYIEIETGDFIMIDSEVETRRIFIQNTDGKLFRRATQSEMDEWMSVHYPDSDNAKVFNIFKNQNQEIDRMNDLDSDSDDEDPYFRGNIEEYMKQNKH